MNAVEEALFTRLTQTGTTLYDLIGVKVYNKLAPQGTPCSYVIFANGGGGDLNETPQDSAQLVYLVKGISDRDYTAGQIDDAIRERLHGQVFNIAGWSMLGCVREQEVQIVDMVNGAPVFHRGAIYRVFLSK